MKKFYHYSVKPGDIFYDGTGWIKVLEYDGNNFVVVDLYDIDKESDEFREVGPKHLLTERELLHAIHTDTGHVYDRVDFTSEITLRFYRERYNMDEDYYTGDKDIYAMIKYPRFFELQSDWKWLLEKFAGETYSCWLEDKLLCGGAFDPDDLAYIDEAMTCN